ncbi:MAG: amidohydrolase [Candidatus Abyssobacteria bacterium SURF_17]|uniref:Amidohydrolase n=1 Tax=Candidatus Abyssobacteria bacterium SURF_17 TaxID=2093361 RepID=A0A419EUM9_9BACT|nr:MAG: amidohydrolase [Candidatus Abyssubacteria bacterium SURF_17]
MIDLLIKRGDVFTMAGDGVGYIGDGAVAIEGNTIAAVGRTAELEKAFPAKRTIDATTKAVLPGLIDGHLHTVIALLRGLGQDAPTWHEGVDPYFEQLSTDAVLAGAQLSAIEAIRAGTTTLGDYGPGMLITLPFYEKLGIRAKVCSLISEVPPVESILKEGELYPFDPSIGELRLRENLELIENWNGAADGRITVMIGPQGPDYCSRELFRKIKETAEKRNVKIHLHIAQGDREILQMKNRYGMRPVEFLADIGYLDEQLIAVHMVKCTDEEVERIARSGASMAFCPSSLIICDGIVPPADVFLRAGGNVCLGTDETSSNNGTNIFSEMKLGSLALNMKNQDPTFLPTWKALRMATIEGAKAIGLDHEIGSLEAGKKADIILVDLTKPSMMPVLRDPVRNIVPNLVLSARGDEVVMSIIDGKVVYEDGKITTLDESELLAFIQQTAEEVNEQASKEVRKRRTVQQRLTRENKY